MLEGVVSLKDLKIYVNISSSLLSLSLSLYLSLSLSSWQGLDYSAVSPMCCKIHKT